MSNEDVRKAWSDAKDVQVVALREALLDMLRDQHIHPVVACLAMTEAIALLLNNHPPRMATVVEGLREILVLVMKKETGPALELATLWKAKLGVES